MAHLYKFVDAASDWKKKVHLLEEVLINIAEKTQECAGFIREYTFRKFGGTLE